MYEEKEVGKARKIKDPNFKKQEEKKYDPYQTPANEEIARIHQEANHFRIPPNEENVFTRLDHCECCMMPVYQERIKFCSSINTIEKASSTYFVMFWFIIFSGNLISAFDGVNILIFWNIPHYTIPCFP